MHKKKPRVYYITILSVVLVAISVVFVTSYFGNHFIPEQPPQPAEINTPAVSIEEPEIIEEADIEPEEEEPPPADTVYSINELYPDMTFLMDAFSKRYNSIAVSFVLFDGDERDYYTYVYGQKNTQTKQPIDSETKFCVASLSKIVTVICAMKLVEEGKLDLDEDITEYLGYRVRNPRFSNTVITTRMLMQHQSSLNDTNMYLFRDNKELPETTERMLKQRVNYAPFQPGTAHHYSGYFAYSVIGLICEIITEKRFDDFAREVLFDPLDIDAAFLPDNLSDNSNLATLYDGNHEEQRSVREQLAQQESRERISDHDLVGANLTITPVDYAKILIMLGNGGTFDDVRILSEATVRAIHDANVQGPGYKQGLATRYQDNDTMPYYKSYWHLGGAWGVNSQYIHYIGNSPNRGTVIVTTGAGPLYLQSQMIDMCTDLSLIAELIFPVNPT